MILCGFRGLVGGLWAEFSNLALCWGCWAVVILCGSSWIAWWLVKGISLQVSRRLGGWGFCDSLWIFMDQLVACGRSFSELAGC